MKKRKLGRTASHRKALFRSLVTAVLEKGRIRTTEAKAKAVRPFIDEMITLAKRGDLSARRRAAAFLLDKQVVKRLFDEIGPRYADRQGGYSRIVKLGPRRGDGALEVILELV